MRKEVFPDLKFSDRSKRRNVVYICVCEPQRCVVLRTMDMATMTDLQIPVSVLYTTLLYTTTILLPLIFLFFFSSSSHSYYSYFFSLDSLFMIQVCIRTKTE